MFTTFDIAIVAWCACGFGYCIGVVAGILFEMRYQDRRRKRQQ